MGSLATVHRGRRRLDILRDDGQAGHAGRALAGRLCSLAPPARSGVARTTASTPGLADAMPSQLRPLSPDSARGPPAPQHLRQQPGYPGSAEDQIPVLDPSRQGGEDLSGAAVVAEAEQGPAVGVGLVVGGQGPNPWGLVSLRNSKQTWWSAVPAKRYKRGSGVAR